jgi:hypothetical protein
VGGSLGLGQGGVGSKCAVGRLVVLVVVLG